MDLKSQFTIYLIIFLIMMYIIGVGASYIVNYSFYILLFYLFSIIVRENPYLLVLSFCCLILYGIYIFQRNPILEEAYNNYSDKSKQSLNYFTFPVSIYQNLLNSIQKHQEFNPNDYVVMYQEPQYYSNLSNVQFNSSHFIKPKSKLV